MSRLYEALQRADQERKTAQSALEDPLAGAPFHAPPPEPAAAGVAVADGAFANGAAAVQDFPAHDNSAPDFSLQHIARHSWRPHAASFPTLAERGEGVEQFRSLRTHIYQARYDAPLKTVLVSSGIPSEGKTFVSANLAINMARNTPNDILLIDGDLRRPSLHTLLGAPQTPGLSEYLAGEADWKDILQRDSTPVSADPSKAGGISNLAFIPSGHCGDNSAELVANGRMEELIAALAPHFDWILIDSPPVLAVTDAVELAHAADAVLLVVRGGRTPFDVAQRAKAAFNKARILGFVLNDVKELPRDGYRYYNYYRASDAQKRAK